MGFVGKNENQLMIRDDLQRKVETYFATGKIRRIFKLEGGYWNQVFKIETESGDFALRVCNPRTKAESVSLQHKLMRFLHAQIPEVSLPVTGSDGGTFFIDEARVISLLTFLPGEMASRQSAKHQISAAAMLGRLHRTARGFPETFVLPNYEPLAEFDWQENSNWRWTDIQDLLTEGAEGLKKRLVVPPFGKDAFDSIEQIAQRKKQIEAEREKAKAWIRELKNSGREPVFAPTHGDYYPGNLLAIGDKISGVIDWDVCQSDWLIHELSRALWEFCRYDETPVVNRRNSDLFLRAYREAGGVVSEAEFDLIVPFIRTVRIQEVLFALGEAIRGEWWEPEYTLYNLEALDKIESGKLFV